MSQRGVLVPMSRSMTANSSSHNGNHRTSSAMDPPQPLTLPCNLCHKSLVTTCFLCACDCIFCEDCTFAHFEQSSQCPLCHKNLTENDFTELVVADSTSGTSDITKTSFQALFSKQARSSSQGIKGLPLSDLCFSLVRQIDVVKRSSNFLLKQLLMSNNATGRKMISVLKANDGLKHENTNLKQSQSTQRIQYEQIHSDLKNRLDAKDIQIHDMGKQLEEKDRIIGQFHQLHTNVAYDKDGSTMGGDTGGHDSGNSFSRPSFPNPYSKSNIHSHHISSSASIASSTIASSRMGFGGTDQPFKGFLAQQQSKQAAIQNQYTTRRGPIPVFHSSTASNRMMDYGNLGPTTLHDSNTSVASSNSGTPKIRDYSQGSMFHFQGSSSGGGGGTVRSGGSGPDVGRLNKRRRPSETPASQHNMSPSTAFALNQGNYSSPRNYNWRS